MTVSSCVTNEEYADRERQIGAHFARLRAARSVEATLPARRLPAASGSMPNPAVR